MWETALLEAAGYLVSAFGAGWSLGFLFTMFKKYFDHL